MSFSFTPEQIQDIADEINLLDDRIAGFPVLFQRLDDEIARLS